MSTVLRSLARLALALAVASAGLLVAAPAKAAAPLSVSLSCEPLGRMRVLCVSTVTGGTGPYSRNWIYNGRRFPSQDNKATTGWSCIPGADNVYTVAVIDANFEIAFATSGSGCNSGNP